MSEIIENENIALKEEVCQAVHSEEDKVVETEIVEGTGIETVEETEIEINQEDMMANFDNKLPKLFRGAIILGTVVKIKNDEVYVDICWKSEGIIPANEISATKVLDVNEILKVGDKITTMVLKVENEDGHAVLSRRRAKEIEAREQLTTFAETKEEIQAVVTEAVKGGLLVDLGMRGFIPASQIQLGYVEDLNQFVGQTLRLRVIEFDESNKKLVLSQKVILAEEQQEKKKQLFSTIKEGDVLNGIVRRLTDFGAFIDIGGVDGLLHISDMAFSRVKHPSEYVKVNDEVEVKILSIDAERGRISLGLKQLKLDPWLSVGDKYAVDSIVKGKVVRIATFGAFVQLEDGVDALVHISQLADRRIAKVDEVVSVGEIITAKIIECKPEEKRISLSIREVLSDERKSEEKELIESQEEEPNVTIGDYVSEVAKEKSEE